ncbi:MAG: NAD(P)H-binding protein [Halofilum sp. (in: g-proteobacteria)]|nr:NAD(P)H-binding protein [Halofilum sp. (in: g-proteobacteria)]
MAGRIVTVFGGTGFLGGAIVERLLGDGWQVRSVARHAVTGERGGVAGIAADITDPAAVADAIAGAQAVVNAVSLYRERAGASFDAVHVEAAAGLARAAGAAGVRKLVHVSGIGADPASASRYVAARGAGEVAVRAALPAAVILRPGVLFGPDDAFLSTLDAVTRLPVVPLFGSGRTRLQPVHVADVAAAVARVIGDAAPPARLYELGGAEVLEYRRIVELVLQHRGRRRPLLPVPFAAWRALAAVAGLLPGPPLTRDQVILMQRDNVAAPAVAGFAALGIEARGLSAGLAEALAGH